jgi:hypothetical protein
MSKKSIPERPLHERLEFAVFLIMESNKKMHKLGNTDPELRLQIRRDLEHAKFVLLGQANRLRRELSLPVISISQLKHKELNRAMEYASPS